MPFPRTLVSATFALVCCSASAVAETPAENFLKAWITSIDTSADWEARYASLSSDPTGARTTLTGLDLKSERPGFTVHVDSLTVTGFAPSSDGAFTASEVDVDGGKIGIGFVALGITNAALKDFSLPPTASFAWNDPRPFVAMVKALAPLAKVRMSSGRIGSLVLMEEIDGVRSRASYDDIAIENWADGKIAAITAGPLKTETPAEEPLTAVSVAKVETRGVDLDAILRVFDPDRYVGGAGDMTWQTAVASAVYRDMIAAIPGVSMRIDETGVYDLKVRQPKAGIDALFNLAMTQINDPSENPTEAMRALELLTAYGFGKFEMRGLDVRGTGIDQMHMDRFALVDFSSDRLGEIAVEGVAGAVPGQGTVKVGRFALGGLVPPSLDAIIAAAKAQEAGANIDVSSVLPELGFVEAQGIDVAPDGLPETSLERFRVDLGHYVGPVPTSVVLDLAGADVAVSMIEDPKARQQLADLGYDRVRLDAALRADWSTAGEIAITDFRMAMRDLGGVSGNVTLTGIRPDEIDHLDQDTAIEKLSFVHGSLTVSDDSIVGRAITKQARQLKADPAKFREQFAMGLPFMLTFLGDIDLQKQLAPVLATFIRTTGGSITALAGPAEPVPLALILANAEASPFDLLKQLSLSFTGVAGTTPPPTPAPPEQEATAPAETAPPTATAPAKKDAEKVPN